MGLDTVELVVNVEKAFGITIPDREAEKIITVGDFHAVVWRYVQGRQSMRCKSQQLYYKLRHALIHTFKVERNDIQLSASLNEIFPQTNRRLLYRKLERELQLKLPQLVLPATWANALNIAGIILIPGMLVWSLVLVKLYDYTSWLYLLPVLGIIGTIFLSNILDPVRTVFNPETVKAFTQLVLSQNYATLIQETGTNQKEVEMVINHLIADKSGLELHEITPEKSITNDLGMN
ncbi:acyl carrier protein [Niastella caeni]|uniref:acyl carrier protein n=1 Tax=Niastella caeni TaxID=2569763 RepID=UPI001AA099CA|nr:acyl carrier protein [Niastella caeni]